MFDVIGIGRNCVDYLALLERLPRENTKAEVVEHLTEGGGQSSTAMVALSRLGLRVAFAGLAGDDDPGHFSLDSLSREGVDVSLVRILPGVRTPVAQIWVNQASGSRTIVYLDSLAGYLSGVEIPVDQLLNTRCLMVDPFGAPWALKIAVAARDRGISLVYDAERPGPHFEPMLEAASHIVASEEILPGRGHSSPEAALTEFMARGDKQAAVITMGERGSLGLDREGFHYQPAFPVEVVDTTAAGDAYHAGFVYGVVQGWSLARSMEFASALGALICRGLGGRRTLPTLAEAESLISSGGRG